MATTSSSRSDIMSNGVSVQLGPSTSPRDESATPVVELADVTTGYQRRTALSGVSLVVPPATMLAVVGPNGSGKSTLLKLLLGLIEPWSGAVRVLGGSPREARARIGYVPQTSTGDWRFPATVGEAVMMGRYRRIGLFRRPGKADRSIVQAALEQVGMADRIGDQVGELSGGQQQRVFLARALVQEPDLLLLDEPMSGVDALTEQDVYALLGRLRDRGVSVLVTTHNLSTVPDHFNLALFLNRGVVAFGTPSEIFTEEHLKAAYGPRMALVKVGDRFFAVDTGGHCD
jgi:ABC-type Mn2+/Zn2+ transport system ATPase subunit